MALGSSDWSLPPIWTCVFIDQYRGELAC